MLCSELRTGFCPNSDKRIIDIKKSGQTEGEIETGNTTIIRDYVDVRDFVRAYCGGKDGISI